MKFIKHLLWLSTVLACSSEPHNSTPDLINGTLDIDRDSGALGVYKSAIMMKFNGNARCTATVVNDKTIVTAAHCISNSIGDVLSGLTKKPVYMSNLRSRYVSNTSNWHKNSIQEAHIHPNFKNACMKSKNCDTESFPKVGADDIAVIKFSGELPGAWTRAKVDRNPVEFGDSISFVGYGCESRNKSIRNLVRKKVGVTQALDVYDIEGSDPDNETWQNLHRSSFASLPTASEADSFPLLCPGDSGGPVYRTGTQNLVGVNSAAKIAEPEDSYNLHARVTGDMSFLETHLEGEDFTD